MSLEEALKAQEEGLLNCVHCGFCLPACPTYVRLGDEADSPRGRLHLMRAVVEGRLPADSPAFQEHLGRCLGCRACEPVCPSGVEYGMLLERGRQVARAALPADRLTRLLLALIRRPMLRSVWFAASRFLRAIGAHRIAGLLPSRPSPVARLRFALAMLGSSVPPRFVAIAAAPEDERGSGPEEGSASTSFPDGEGASVGLLRGCVQAGLFGRVNEATRRVLEVNGFSLYGVPGQGCCGALHAHAGELDAAREMARRNIEAFEEAGVERIVVNAAGCGAAMKDYLHLFAGDEEWKGRAARFTERVRDVSELLGSEGRCRTGAPLPMAVAVDPPCHLLHAQGVKEPPLRMLEAIPGLEVVEVEGGEECCGGAGIYGLTQPQLGRWIGGDKVAAVARTGAEWLATGNAGCIMQIGAGLSLSGLPVQVCHPVELLDESYRRAGHYAGDPGR